MGPDTQAERRVYQVAEINRLASAVIENEFGYLWVEGELSGVTHARSGHLYFSLKDEKAVLHAAFFRGSQRGLAFEPRDGLKVQAYGQLTIYEARGNYQMVVRQLEEAGKGSLQEAFEKLKKKLAAEGLFAEERKRPIPLLPQHVGIVTSPTGAAIRDMLQVVARRFPNLHIVLAPTKVQGGGAAEEIAEGIRGLNEFGGIDVIILGRGGGSLEDLWAFNEEIVARAIAASGVPVISAVGHETDFTIADFVADLRAPTPSAAAELVVGRKEAFEEQLSNTAHRLARGLQTSLLELKNRLLAVSRSYVFREPHNLVKQHREIMEGLRRRMVHSTTAVMQRRQQRLDEAALRLGHRLEAAVATRKQDLRRVAAQVHALSPIAILDRGFSITRSASGHVVRSAEEVEIGDALETLLAHDRILSHVSEKQPGVRHGRREKE